MPVPVALSGLLSPQARSSGSTACVTSTVESSLLHDAIEITAAIKKPGLSIRGCSFKPHARAVRNDFSDHAVARQDELDPQAIGALSSEKRIQLVERLGHSVVGTCSSIEGFA